MPIVETLAVALEALRANKLRSFLTMLGIVIGVAAVIAMVALGRGAQQSVKERIASLGTTLLTVTPGQARGPGFVASSSDRAPLMMDDSDAIDERATFVTAVQPEISRSLQVVYGSRNTNTAVVGATANYLEVRRFTIDSGRMFSTAEDAARRRVAVVGPQVVSDLGVAAPAALVGENVRINGIQFEVIGVLASKGQGAGFANPDDQVLVPIQTARYRLIGNDHLRAINVLSPSEDDIPATMAEVRRILRREHRLRTGQDDDFTIRIQSDFLATLGETTQVFTYLLAGIAAVSLLVGGIGIMNIMLVSVTERTREIGVRKALGATQANILLQFLIEAVVLCLLGGTVGIGLGSGSAVFLRSAFQWNTSVGASSILIAFAFAAAVGVVFGVWPARRAAALDPIESLRYE
ncbi:MAG: FtsX-like permease family protein [Candidatus Eisenbacteria bacterium]|uniref:FtsX-like permease family protein n=1 Tax=Eiseniibacteriota bacterium TaxID=2212470 RepID=A0A538SIN5_UNCEI|nr:MAG: FtsX-like permease family protein [Candidatus Eisenbacteria bacterium]